MRLWPRRRTPAPMPPRANPTRIALLEHALNGTEPAPGTWAATVLMMNQAGTCLRHRPIDLGYLSDGPGTRGVCEGCWRGMTLSSAGEWEINTTA